jgi:hypothetical protein
MVYLVLTAISVTSLMAAAVTVLIRRDRRRMDPNPESQRIEAAATRGVRDARRQARAHQHFNDGRGISALRDRDSL